MPDRGDGGARDFPTQRFSGFTMITQSSFWLGMVTCSPGFTTRLQSSASLRLSIWSRQTVFVPVLENPFSAGAPGIEA